MKTGYVLPAVLLLQMICCCCCNPGGWGLIYEHDLTKNYSVWATDLPEQACIVKKATPTANSAPCVVNQMVFAYGWNDDFIIAKQHPAAGFTPNLQITNWFLIEVENGKVHGPLTEAEFIELRALLNVLADLTFTETIEPDSRN